MHVVIYEDSEADTRLLSMALKNTCDNIKITPIHACLEDDACVNLIEGEPDIFFIDINMPQDGFEILAALKNKEKYQGVPMVVCSTSNNPDDIKKAGLGGANGYITKPADFIKVSLNAIITAVKAQPTRLFDFG